MGIAISAAMQGRYQCAFDIAMQQGTGNDLRYDLSITSLFQKSGLILFTGR